MSLKIFGAKGSNPTKLQHVMCRLVGVITRVQLFVWGDTAPLKFGKAKNVQNSLLFRTTSEFERKYMWNG